MYVRTVRRHFQKGELSALRHSRLICVLRQDRPAADLKILPVQCMPTHSQPRRAPAPRGERGGSKGLGGGQGNGALGQGWQGTLSDERSGAPTPPALLKCAPGKAPRAGTNSMFALSAKLPFGVAYRPGARQVKRCNQAPAGRTGCWTRAMVTVVVRSGRRVLLARGSVCVCVFSLVTNRM